jgi:hypothetical protein
MVAADVEESAQDAVAPSHDQDRLPGNLAGDVLPRLANLLGSPNPLPRARKDRSSL